MATEATLDHLGLARKFLQKSREYLEVGDLHQASEKGWGAGSHIIKAVATENNWPYDSHDEFEGVVVNARQRYRVWDLLDMSRAAEALHRNYYKRSLLLNAEVIENDLDQVKRMVDSLQPYLQ